RCGTPTFPPIELMLTIRPSRRGLVRHFLAGVIALGLASVLQIEGRQNCRRRGAGSTEVLADPTVCEGRTRRETVEPVVPAVLSPFRRKTVAFRSEPDHERTEQSNPRGGRGRLWCLAAESAQPARLPLPRQGG